jgi:hypothetical protein
MRASAARGEMVSSGRWRMINVRARWLEASGIRARVDVTLEFEGVVTKQRRTLTGFFEGQRARHRSKQTNPPALGLGKTRGRLAACPFGGSAGRR